MHAEIIKACNRMASSCQRDLSRDNWYYLISKLADTAFAAVSCSTRAF